MVGSKTLIVDAGVLYAMCDAADPDHAAARETLVGWRGELVVSAFTAAEADYLILSRLGIEAELAFLADLSASYLVVGLDGTGIAAAAQVCARYRDLEIGLADASIVVLAEKWSTGAVATFDHRHFRSLAPLQGGTFQLLPG